MRLSPQHALVALLPLGLLLGWPLQAQELLKNPAFEDDLYDWTASAGEAVGTVSVNDDGPEGGRALTFNITKAGKTDLILHQPVDLGFASSYRLSFWARSDLPASILIVPARNYGDFGPLADGWGVELTSDWTKHEKVFTVHESDRGARINFLTTKELPLGKVQFARFSLEEVQ